MKLCLIVDDSDIVRKYARLIFQSLEYRAIEADSTAGALDRIAIEAPHVMLVDWRIPGCNTHEFIAQVRRMSLERRPYIIYVATENDAADFERAKTAGVDDFLLKPFNRDIIEMKLQEIRVAA